MSHPENKFRFWYQKPVVWIAIVVVTCLGFLAMPRVQAVYHRWTGVRKVQRATEALAKKDYKTAVLNARGALATNAKNLDALRVMAGVADALDPLQALDFRRQIEAINPNDAENLIGLAQASLKGGDVNAAAQALKKVPSAKQATTQFHDVAAEIAFLLKDVAGFTAHTEESLKLSPEDDSYHLKLAVLRLKAKSPEVRSGALTTLERLKARPITSSAALRALLRDAMDRGERSRAIELANELVSASDASLGDKLTRLSAWCAMVPSEGSTPISASPVRAEELYLYLAEVQQEVATQPERIAKVITWMNEHHMALQVPEWVAALPAEVVAKPPVGTAVAESLSLASNWAALKDSLENASWERFDFQRFVYLSRAFEGLKDPAGAASAWSRALESAEADPMALQQVAADVSRWGWDDKAETVLWKLAAKGRAPRWVGDSLWKIAFKRSDTSSLYRASKLLMEAEPKSVSARNSYIHLALITQQDEASAHPLAETLYRENRADSSVVPTYALSLFRQGRPDDAVAALAALSPEQFQEPWLALYHAHFLTAAGRPEEAEKYVQFAGAAPLLPEMESVRRLLSVIFEARRFDREGKREECSAAWRSAIALAGARADALELLAKTAIQWHWEDRAGEALTKLVGMGRCPAWGIPTLWSASLKSAESSEIYKAAKVVLDSNPKDFEARKNFISVALLAGKTADLPHQLAEALHLEDPGNAEGAATYSLSLYCQGQFERAVAVLRGLKPEQLGQQRPALYLGMTLAALGLGDEAEPALRIGATGPLLPEEKEIVDILGAVFEWRAAQQRGDSAVEAAAWKKAIAVAERRPRMLEAFGKILLKWEAAERATEVLWRLTGVSDCPRWVIDRLWADAEKRRDAGKLYQLSRLLRRAAPEDITARNHFVRLSLLTGQDADFPHRLADSLLEENPGNAEVAATCALSLLQREKLKEAFAVLSTLRPEQLKTPRVAYYYGLVLTASGEVGKAQQYLRIASAVTLLAEEESLLAKITSAPAASLRR